MIDMSEDYEPEGKDGPTVGQAPPPWARRVALIWVAVIGGAMLFMLLLWIASLFGLRVAL